MTKTTPAKITAQKLRNNLGEFLDRADYARETFTITRAGRHKAVLVGVTAHAIGDRVATGIGGDFPGVEFQATAIDNVLAGDFISSSLYLTEPKYVFMARARLNNPRDKAILLGASNMGAGFKQGADGIGSRSSGNRRKL